MGTDRARVLVVEDDPSVRGLLLDVLVGEGFEGDRRGDGDRFDAGTGS